MLKMKWLRQKAVYEYVKYVPSFQVQKRLSLNESLTASCVEVARAGEGEQGVPFLLDTPSTKLRPVELSLKSLGSGRGWALVSGPFLSYNIIFVCLYTLLATSTTLKMLSTLVYWWGYYRVM